MVRGPKNIPSKQDWIDANPVEADILNLIDAARKWAESRVEYVLPDDHNDIYAPPKRVVNELTDLELSIERAINALEVMMKTAQARKAAGLRRRGRSIDKSYDPNTTSITDPQVEVIFKLIRKQVSRQQADSEIAKIISPAEKIDHRTLKTYVDQLIWIWSWFDNGNSDAERSPSED